MFSARLEKAFLSLAILGSGDRFTWLPRLAGTHMNSTGVAARFVVSSPVMKKMPGLPERRHRIRRPGAGCPVDRPRNRASLDAPEMLFLKFAMCPQFAYWGVEAGTG